MLLYHNFNFIEYFNYGWLGVDLFFVLSGFLITDILLNSLNSKNYFKTFYARRVLRIFPLYYLSLILFIWVIPAISPALLDMTYYKEHQIWFWTYLQNWPLIFKSDSGGTVLNHYWSLAIEEQYYLIWPVIILLLKKPKRILLLCIFSLAIVIISRFYIWENRNEFPSYERAFLFTRIDGILIGAMLASVYNMGHGLFRKYFTIFLLSLTAVNYVFYLVKKNQSPDFPVWGIAGFTTFSLIFAIIVYEAVMKENKIVNFILSNSILRFLGKYSYGFYIFHWPVAIILSPVFYNMGTSLFQKDGFVHLFFVGILSSLAGLLISILSWHLLEKHFLKMKKFFN